MPFQLFIAFCFFWVVGKAHFRGYGYAEALLKAFCTSETVEEPLFEYPNKKYCPLSCFLWNFICDYLKDDTKSLSIVHSLDEIHDSCNYLYKGVFKEFSPDNRVVRRAITSGKPLDVESIAEYYSKENDETKILNSLRNEARQDGAQYVDCQLDFYLRFVNLNIDTVVIMGDHGRGARGYPISGSYQPFFSIVNKKLTPGVNSRLFSYINLFDLLYDFCIGKYDITPYERSYVYCSDYPLYNKTLLCIHMKRLGPIISRYGVSHIITDSDMYSYYFNGTEYYYRLSDETVNLINDNRYSSRVAELKGKLGKIDTDYIFAQKKFCKTRELLFGGNDVEKLIDEELYRYINSLVKSVHGLLPLYPESYRKPIEV